MNYEDAINRLEFHYGPVHDDKNNTSVDQESLHYALFTLRFKIYNLDLSIYFKDIINCLEVINIQLKGPNPLELPYNDQRKFLDRKLVSIIQGILHNLHHTEIELKFKKADAKIIDTLIKYRYLISECWIVILEGGDFENIIKDEVEPLMVYLNTMLDKQ